MSERYICPVCGWESPESDTESTWEHCPNCLSGKDMEEYEDGSICGGTLEPISIWVRKDGAWEVVQRCRLCGDITSSPLTKQDNPIKALSIAAKPLAAPPFPVEQLEKLTKMMGGRGETGGFHSEQRK